MKKFLLSLVAFFSFMAINAADFSLVTSADQLVAGKNYIIVAKDYSYALSVTQKTNNRNHTPIAKGSVITPDETVAILNLKEGTKTDTWSFFDPTNNGYLYAASSSSNYLRTEATLSDNSSASISIATDGVATIKFQGTNTRNWLRYNESSSIFACYGSGQKDVCLYIETESTTAKVATPVITPNEGEITANTKISISCATEGASIYYTIDDSEPSAENGTLYTAPFTLAEDATVKAIAVAEGLDNSNSVTAVFTILKEGTLYYESFDQCTGTGGNDNQWSGSIATSGIKCDNVNNTSIKGFGADKSAKFGSNDEKGSFTTPELTELGNVDGGYAIVSFKAAPWNEESSSIEVSIDGGGTVVSSAIELTPKQWNNCTFSIAGGSATTKITISATQKRFFLDEVMVIASNDTVVAIEEVGVDANAPVEYYNLQGVKVVRPENGIFIKKQGSKATKVVL